MSLTFYYAPHSTASISHWVIEELGVPYEKVRLDLRAGDQHKPAFKKLNPNAKVPVLVHDGKTIFESLAITIYLGETFGVAKGLYPELGPKRAEALQWLVWAQVSLGGAQALLQSEIAEYIPVERRNAAAADAARAELAKLCAIFDDALDGKTWVLGDKFSLVDAHVASWFGYIGMTGTDLSRFTKLTAWLARAEGRPAHVESSKP